MQGKCFNTEKSLQNAAIIKLRIRLVMNVRKLYFVKYQQKAFHLGDHIF